MRPPKLTRRSFLKTAAVGSAAAAVTVGLLSGCTHSGDEETSEPVVVDEDSAESILDTFESVDLALTEEAAWSFPLGNVLHPGEATWIPVTTAGSSATPMVKASVLSLASGQLAEVVSAPFQEGATKVIYDARCSDYVYAWVELDLATRDWALYAAPFSAGALSGDVRTLCYGLTRAFVDRYDPAELLARCGITVEGVAGDALGALGA